MADTAKKTTVTGAPRKASAKTEKAAEVAKPTTASRKKLELVAKADAPKKAATAPKKAKAAPKPRKSAAKKDNVVAISQPAAVSRETIEQLAYQFWVQRGYQHGYAVQDWLRAEQELLQLAS